MPAEVTHGTRGGRGASRSPRLGLTRVAAPGPCLFFQQTHNPALALPCPQEVPLGSAGGGHTSTFCPACQAHKGPPGPGLEMEQTEGESPGHRRTHLRIKSNK